MFSLLRRDVCRRSIVARPILARRAYSLGPEPEDGLDLEGVLINQGEATPVVKAKPLAGGASRQYNNNSEPFSFPTLDECALMLRTLLQGNQLAANKWKPFAKDRVRVSSYPK